MNKDSAKLILPIAAFLVIVQSVVIVNNIMSSKQVVPPVANVEQPEPTQAPKVIESEFYFAGPASMQQGRSYPVELRLKAKKPLSLISVETVVGFDSRLVKASQLKTSDTLGKPVFSTINNNLGVVVSNSFLSSALVMAEGQDVLLQTFTVTPTVAGTFTLDMQTGSEKTLLVSTNNAQVVEFSSLPLVVEVTR